MTRKSLSKSAWRIALAYVGFAALWIFTSDRVLGLLTRDPEGMTRWATVKGFAFVLITGGLLFWVLQRTFGRVLRVQAALADSEAQFRLLFETMTQGVVFQDALGRITAANPTAERILGLSIAEMRGRTLGDPQWRTIHEDGTGFPAGLHPGMIALRSGNAVRDVVMGVYHPPKGDHVWVSIQAVPQFKGNESHPYQVYTTFEDITARRQAVLERKELDRRLGQQEKLEAIGLLSAGVAHDFNNLLMPIIGIPEMMIHSPEAMADRQKVENSLRSILAAGRDAREIVRRLREFYRPTDLEVGEVSVTELIQQAVAMTEPVWKVQAGADGKMIDVKMDFHDAQPIQGNAAALREMLTNLLFNAVDAIPRKGTIILETSADSVSTVIRVSDTGTGMDESVRLHCFDPFFTTKGKKGSGLGLSVCYGVVVSHGGSIDVESNPGLGTTFIIRLPRALQGRKPDSRANKTEGLPGARLGGWRVLVIDDDDVVRKLLSAYVMRAGCRVEAASSGEEGLAKLSSGPFDVVVTDLVMPGIGGGEVARAVKRLAPDTAVLMLTGFGDLMLYRNDCPEGVDEVIGKPVDSGELMEAIDRVVSGKRG